MPKQRQSALQSIKEGTPLRLPTPQPQDTSEKSGTSPAEGILRHPTTGGGGAVDSKQRRPLSKLPIPEWGAPLVSDKVSATKDERGDGQRPDLEQRPSWRPAKFGWGEHIWITPDWVNSTKQIREAFLDLAEEARRRSLIDTVDAVGQDFEGSDEIGKTLHELQQSAKNLADHADMIRPRSALLYRKHRRMPFRQYVLADPVNLNLTWNNKRDL